MKAVQGHRHCRMKCIFVLLLTFTARAESGSSVERGKILLIVTMKWALAE